MRRTMYSAVLAAMALLLGGCFWTAPGAGPHRRAHNSHETTITPETASTLTEAWTATVGLGPVTDPVVSPTGVFTASYFDAVGGAQVTATNLDGSQRWEVRPPSLAETVALGDVFVDGNRIAVGWYNDMAEVSSTSWFDEANGADIVRPTFGLLQSLDGPWAVSVDWNPTGVPSQVTFVNLDDPAQRWSGYNFGTGRPSRVSLGQARAYTPQAAYPLTGGQATCGADPNWPEPCPLWTSPVSIDTPLVISEDETVVFGGSLDGQVHALDAATGALLWSAAVGAAVSDPPALADGMLYVPTADGDLVVLDADGCGTATCEPQWTAAAGSEITEQPAVGGGVVFTASADGGLDAFPAAGCAAATCDPLWSTSTGSTITGAPAIAHGKLFVGTSDGRLIAFEPTA